MLKRRNASKKITGCKKPTATAAVDTVPLGWTDALEPSVCFSTSSAISAGCLVAVAYFWEKKITAIKAIVVHLK